MMEATNNPSTRNYPLWIGTVLTGFFLFLAFVGPRLAPLDPMEVFDEPITQGDASYVPARRAVPPLALDQFPLGTDNAGRDLTSRLLWAVRPTLLLCVIIAGLRLLLGVILGLTAGWFGGPVARLIEILIGVSLAVPVLLFALAVISFMGSRELPVFIVALTATGWAGSAVFVKNSAEIVKQSPFIEGARAAGVRPAGILGRHVLPQLWPALPALIAFELAAVLLVLAELGFLGMFIGDAFVRMIEDPYSGGEIPVGFTAGLPELGQMLSDFWSKMILTPWEVAFIGFAVFLNIFAFNMLGEGLRRQMDVTRPGRARIRRRRYSLPPAGRPWSSTP